MICHRLFWLFLCFFSLILFSKSVLSHKPDLLRRGDSDSEDENTGNSGNSSQSPSSCMRQGIAWTARGVLGTARMLGRTATIVGPYVGAAVKAAASGTRWALGDHVAPRLATLYRDTLVPGAAGAWHNYLLPGTRQAASAAYNRVARPLVQKGARAALRVLDPSWKTAAERAREQEELQQNSPQENGEVPQKNEAEEILREKVQEVRPVQQKKVRWKDQQGQLTNGQEVRQVNENEVPPLLPESPQSFSGFSSSSSNGWEDGDEIEQERQEQPAELVSQQIAGMTTDNKNNLIRRKQSAGKQPVDQEWLPKPKNPEIELVKIEPKKKWWNWRDKKRNQNKTGKKLQ